VLETSRPRPDPREARRAHLVEARDRAQQHLAEARAEVEQLGWWERRRRGPELRSELAFRQVALDHARDCLYRLLCEPVESGDIWARRPELSYAGQRLGRSPEPALRRPEPEPPGIDLGW
jgi:hypothetical protein